MLKRVILITFCFVIQQNFAQHCSEESEEQNDANSISQITKCKVEESETANDTSSADFSLNNRFLKRRKNSLNENSLNHTKNEISENRSVESVELANIKKNINSLVNSISKSSKENIIPFSDVEYVPLFSDCDGDSYDQYDCFSTKMQEHINSNFTYPEEALDKKMEGTVLVSFVIDTNGNVTNIKTISSKNTEILKEEAVRIVSMLPKFIPGENDKQKVNVAYSFPMEFKIDSSN